METESRREFRRAPADQRRVELMEAALRVIGARGLDAASVRSISAEAGVTAGLIRHYFASKEELVCAAYAHHMERLLRACEEELEKAHGSPTERLADFVRRTLTPPVTGVEQVQLWAAFLQKVGHEPRMRQVHAESYGAFRRVLEALLAAALVEQGRPGDVARLRSLSIAANALLDGLWLEASALPEAFSAGEIVRIGLRSISDITGLDLLRKDSGTQ